jgi:hypothetical protein
MKAIKGLERSRVELDLFNGFVMVATFNGNYQSWVTIGMTPNQARKLAGELIHMAHGAETQAKTKWAKGLDLPPRP